MATDMFGPAVAAVDAGIGIAWILILVLNTVELAGRAKYNLRDSSPPSSDLVSVIIPARNEEERIRPCLTSLLAQSHRNLKVIVVDDRSTDRTSEVVAETIRQDPRVKMVDGEELPAGWAGKPWACHQGYIKAEGEWLLFIDSDTILAEGALAAALSHARMANLEAISIVPSIELEGFRAKVVAPVLSAMIRLIYPLSVVNNPDSKTGLVVGGFVLIRKGAYESIGGHQAVRSELVEDKQLGNNLKAMRVPFRLVTGRSLVSVGLFTGGQGIWDSVKRTATNPLRYQRGITGTFAATALVLCTYPSFALVYGVLTNTYSPVYAIPFLLSVGVPAAVVAYDAAGVKDSSPLYALPALAGGILIAAALLRQLLGKSSLRWRGRRYGSAASPKTI